MLDGSGLPVVSATLDSHQDIEFVRGIRSFQRTLHEHSVGFIEEVLF